MVTDHDGIVDHPLRDALILFFIGLTGPAAVLHDQAGRLLDCTTDQVPPQTVAADTAPDS